LEDGARSNSKSSAARTDIDQRAQFESLYREVNTRLAAFVRPQAPRFLVEDIVQDTWMVVWRRWASLPMKLDQRRAWVFGVAKKVAPRAVLRALRQIPVGVEVFEGLTDTRVDDPLSVYLSGEAARALLSTLSDGERDAVILHVLFGMTVNEIAEELVCSTTAVTTRLERARRRARRYRESVAAANRIAGASTITRGVGE
jgi:RNA polymerase sigma-70 factor (ECF subfamily)